MFKILQVLPSLTVGGVERVTVDTAIGLRTAFPQTPTYVASAGGKLVPLLQKAGIEHIEIPALRSKNPFHIIRNAFHLANLIRKYYIDIVHARSRAPAWSAWLATKMTGASFITTYHGFYGGKSHLKKYYNGIMLRGHYVLVISKFLYHYLQETYPQLNSKLRFVPEGIDTQFFVADKVKGTDILSLRQQWQVDPEQHLLLLPARFTERKGHKVALHALHLLQDPNLVIVFLGKTNQSPYYQKLLTLSQNLGITSQIRFIEEGASMDIAYAAADIVLAPAITPETFGRVTAEAGAMQRLIIATSIGATPELCYDQKTGFLIPPNDASALAQTIRTVLALPFEQRQAIGKDAHEHIKAHYSCDRMLEQTLQVYRDVMNEKNSHH